MINKLIALFLVTTQAFAAAPTVIDGGYVRGQSNNSQNFAPNPFAEKNLSGWTATNITATRITSAGNQLNGISSFNLSSATNGGTFVSSAMGIMDGVSGSCEASVRFKASSGSSANYTFYLDNGSGTILNSVVLSNQSVWTPAGFYYPCATGYKLGISHQGTATDVIQVGNFYFGPATGLYSVAQASIIASVSWGSSDTQRWTSTAAFPASLAANASVTAPTYYGCAVDPGSKIPVIKCNNIPSGDYEVFVNGLMSSESTATECQFEIFDGTTRRGRQSKSNNSTNVFDGSGSLAGRFSYSTPQASVTWEIRSGRIAGTPTCSLYATGLEFIVKRFPSQSDIGVKSSDPQTPTIQKLTSGSGTYTTPAKVTYIKVRMVGGGGGGGGANSGASTYGIAGGNGGNTTFGTSLLTANGGFGAGTTLGGAGGTATISAPAIGTAFSGGSGSQGQPNNEGYNIAEFGGSGAASPFGGAGGGGSKGSVNGQAAIANTGSGGGGAGAAQAGYGVGGTGGGAGGYIDAIIGNPLSINGGSFSYSIGAAGTAGGNGGIGGSGYIEVTEYYSTSAPFLISSVTSNSAGLERIERLTFGTTATTVCSASPCAYLSQSGNWVSTVTRSSTGTYTVNFTAGIFSAAPSCTATAGRPGGSPPHVLWNDYVTSSTIPLVLHDDAGGLQDGIVDIICMGPR